MAARSIMNGTIAIAAVLIVGVSLWSTGALAQSSSSCTNELISMSSCLDYIQGNSSTPSSSCCSSLSTVVRSKPECLCQILNGGGSSLGINVNQTQAMTLPAACNVKTPPASQCNATSPSGSPSGGSNKTVPTTNDGTSAGNSSVKLSFSLFFILLFIVSWSP